MADEVVRKPFEESVVELLGEALFMELPAFAKMLNRTIITSNHDAIAELARRRFNGVGWDGNGIAQRILDQKKVAPRKQKSRKKQ